MNDETQKMELTINDVADINIKIPRPVIHPNFGISHHIKIQLGYGEDKNTEYAYFTFDSATNAAVTFDAIVSELKKIISK